MIKYVCDRCDEEFGEYLHLLKIDVIKHNYDYAIKSYDLCERCLKELEEFINKFSYNCG